MKLGYCTWGMMTVPIEEAVPAIAGIGYTGIEIAVTPGFFTELTTLDASRRAMIRQLLDDHDLVLTAVAGHVAMVELDPVAHETNMQRLRGCIDLVADLSNASETPTVCSCVRGRPQFFEERKILLAERVRGIGEYAGARGVVLAIEPHTGTTLDTPDKVEWLMRQVDHPAVKVNFDISHFDVMGYEIEQCVPQMVPYSVHTHVKDERGRYPDHEFLTPGEGPFDYVRYLRAMDAAGYQGYVMVEVSKMVQRRPDYDPFFHAKLAYWTLDKAFKVAGLDRDDV